MSTFQGQTVLVTGAASGIGRATAMAFAAFGARLILADLTDCAEVVQEIETGGAHARAVVCDVSDAGSVDELFAGIDRLDVTAHCAGVLVDGEITEMTAAAFDHQIGVNLRGSFLIAQGSVRIMERRRTGRLILTASELAHQGRAGASAYCASKAGVIGLCRALARECAPDILVNAVAPGPVDTPMLDMGNLVAGTLATEIANPLGRVGQPEEIAAAILFLAGPGGTLMTGQTMCPSGGAVML
ncbi:MAG: SDR family NAD(P)-dependent oxidoreductase [Paracoccaceae bacterium]